MIPMFDHDVANVTLNKRELSADVIVMGQPQVHGRILEVDEDGCVACVLWQMSPGAVTMKPKPDTRDLLYVLEGKADVRIDRGGAIELRPGKWVQMPNEPYQLHVTETLRKISVLYNPNGLSMKRESA